MQQDLLIKTREFLDKEWKSVPKETRDLALDVLRNAYLTDDLQKYGLTSQSYDIIKNCTNLTELYAEDIYQLVGLMRSYIRETTNGAAYLASTYISEDLYNKILKDRNLHTRNVYILNTKVSPTKCLSSKDIICQAESRFGYLPTTSIFYQGTVESA